MKRSTKLIVVASLALNVLLVVGIIVIVSGAGPPKPQVEELGGGFTLETTVVDPERDIRDIVLCRDGMVVTKIVAEEDYVVSIMPTPRTSDNWKPAGCFASLSYGNGGMPPEVLVGDRGNMVLRHRYQDGREAVRKAYGEVFAEKRQPLSIKRLEDLLKLEPSLPIILTVEQAAPYSKAEEVIRLLAKKHTGQLAVGFEPYRIPSWHVDPPKDIVRPEKPWAPKRDQKRPGESDRK